MAKYNKNANLTCVMIVQQLEAEHWLDWDKNIIEGAKTGSIKPLLKEMVKRFEINDCIVSEAYGIKHDKDEITIWDNEKKQNVSQTKTSHVHLLIKFDKGATLNMLSIRAGLEPQYLEKAKSGRYGYDNLLAYLVHAKDRNKYQYSPEEVETETGEEYSSVYNRRMETWYKGRATKEAVEANLSIDYLISEILEGHINKSQLLLTDDYYKIYALNQRRVEDALSAYAEKKGFKTILDLENGEFKKTVLFITGESGVGKTKFSKFLISKIKEIALDNGEHWEHCITASTNSFDGYNGEEILFMDDVRGSSLTASDWLKLLDPYSISPISARYRNKIGSAKFIIITSILDPHYFFYASKEGSNEDINQFIRRIDLLTSIIDKKCYLAKPTKKKESPSQEQKNSTLNKFSYQLKIGKAYKKNEATAKILDTFKANMKWKNTKKRTSKTLKSTGSSPKRKQ